MEDIAFIGFLVLFFALSWGFVELADRIQGG